MQDLGSNSRLGVREQIARGATESGQATWLASDLEYFRARNGTLFAGLFGSDPLVLALDPISDGTSASLDAALADLVREFPLARRIAFVGASSAFVEAMPARFAAQAIQIGHEPWVDLDAHEAKGNRARGVRSARNQALRAGIRVERVDGRALAHPGSESREKTDRLLGAWRNQGLLEIGGFLQRVDPFHDAANRFYFVACAPDGKWVGMLAAVRIGATRSVFLEDLILDPRAEGGVGELLTLEAFRFFAEEGYSEASLGTVSLTQVAPHAVRPPSPRVYRGLSCFLRTLRRLYNADGIELFRKRFAVRAWRPIYFGVARTDGRRPGAGDWLRALFAILAAHRPRLVLTPQRIGRRPVPVAVCAGLAIAFFFTHLPKHAHAAHHLPPFFAKFDGHRGEGDNRSR
ncbi:MAG: DUF2156 domain-containing protein [Bdellovibrionales bacterium]|nr:DUF2156 domain-containing protein [Bdellovibrionales bacterium]